MPSDRLAELQRQRALAQEQLAWLDREIARETAAAGLPASSPGAYAALTSPNATVSGISAKIEIDPTLPPEARVLISDYAKQTGRVQDDVKRGCFLYFAIAFGVLLLGVLALYLYTVLKRGA